MCDHVRGFVSVVVCVLGCSFARVFDCVRLFVCSCVVVSLVSFCGCVFACRVWLIRFVVCAFVFGFVCEFVCALV